MVPKHTRNGLKYYYTKKQFYDKFNVIAAESDGIFLIFKQSANYY